MAKAKMKSESARLRLVTPLQKLAKVVGVKPMPPIEVTRRLWAYIDKNGLQDKKNRRLVNTDENLKAIFGGRSTVTLDAITKLVNRQLR